MQVLPCDIHRRINRLVCSTMAIFAGFTSYVVSVTKALSITYITGKNWISLLCEYKLNPYDELQFGLTKTPQLVLLAFKRNEEKNWITVTDPSQVRKLIIADQTRSPLSRTDRAPAVALALIAAAAQSDPAEDWARPRQGISLIYRRIGHRHRHLLRHWHQLYKEHHLRQQQRLRHLHQHLHLHLLWPVQLHQQQTGLQFALHIPKSLQKPTCPPSW